MRKTLSPSHVLTKVKERLTPEAHANTEVNKNPEHLALTKAELFARIQKRPGEPDEMTNFVNNFDHINNYLCQVNISSPVDHKVDLQMTGTSDVDTGTQVAQHAAPEDQVAPDEEAAPEDSVTQVSNFDHDYDVSDDETRRPAPHPSQVTLPLQPSPTVQEDVEMASTSADVEIKMESDDYRKKIAPLITSLKSRQQTPKGLHKAPQAKANSPWNLMEAEAVRENEENPGAPQVRTIMGRLYDQQFPVKKSGAGKSRQMKLWKTLSTLRRQQRYVIVLFRNSTINTALGDWLTPQIVDTWMNLYGVPIEILLRRLEAEHHEQRDGAVEEELVLAGAADQDTWCE
ncbi:hypothetical protein OEA41_008501 [Lepraria neglecta]|uniref:Uncharacterized protein n=1 Tax=Lepraria neglecta TaxID=209136 RepID=A0AAD9ZET3_9LECA|nr:hypothetical protein OEA41_008501 [Lepraria neglecta]